ncbi:DNA mismatch endonuclease Vsr [Thalassoroseus pseudoceratinae]|uniref:DNA mismatch endonuclease Vsr n=1 Tax=Thalassoroseus pseudoceratinae TaxID=2713176 RepID=UPI001423BF24
MTDNLTPAQRSHCVSRVKGCDTKLECRVRSALHAEDFRFRKHVRSLPGRPDVVFPTEKVAVSIDGDFWHGWRFPKWEDSLSEFWRKKIAQTRVRDRRNFRRLRADGSCVIRIWEQ